MFWERVFWAQVATLRELRRKRILDEGSCGARWEPNRPVTCGLRDRLTPILSQDRWRLSRAGPMWFRKSVATSVVWPMMKILESIAQPMSGIGLKCSSMAKVAPSLFGILITTNNCSNQSWRVIWAEQ